MGGWLINETSQLTLGEAEREALPSSDAFQDAVPPVAVQITELLVADVRKWFGASARIRLDTLVQTVPRRRDRPSGIYEARTARFPNIRKGDRLQIENGLAVYLGHPRYFLDLRVQVSRDSDDSPDLVELLADNTEKLAAVAAPVLDLAGGVPYGTAISAVAHSAGAAADLTMQLLTNATGRTIGFYAGTWYAGRDGFGIGRHPPSGLHTSNDMAFAYEIFRAVENTPE